MVHWHFHLTRVSRLFRAVAAALAMMGAVPAAEPFTVVVLPDTQNYVKGEGSEEKFLAQTRWIRDNVEKLNIRAVIHEGDITDDNSPQQWEKAKACLEPLAGIGWMPCVGNHDIGHNGPAKGSDAYAPQFDRKYAQCPGCPETGAGQ